MAPTVAELLEDYVHQPELVERIGYREHEPPVEIIAPQNAEWAEAFDALKNRIIAALGDTAVAVHHTGSTSIPDLPAKDIIDIDLVVKDSADEAAYVTNSSKPASNSSFARLGGTSTASSTPTAPAQSICTFGARTRLKWRDTRSSRSGYCAPPRTRRDIARQRNSRRVRRGQMGARCKITTTARRRRFGRF